MACEIDKKRNCFTFIWKVENAEYWWENDNMPSPVFTVDEIGDTKWQLLLYFDFTDTDYYSQLYLKRVEDNEGVESVEIDCELACLSTDGTVLFLFEKKKSVIGKNGMNALIGSDDFPSRYDVFFERRSEFLSKGALTVRCRIWKSEGEISKNVQCIARTRLVVEKMSCLWSIENFSRLENNYIKIFEIKSLVSGEQLLAVELFFSGGLICKETIRLKIKPNYQHIKMAALQVSIVDASKNTVKCFQDDFWIKNRFDSKEFVLFDSRREIMEKKNAYLPHDVLSLLFECSFSFGKLEEEIEFVTLNCPEFISNKTDDRCLDTANKLSDPKINLINDFKSMLNNGKLSDVKLKTQNKTFPSHKCILSLRSPVFEAMFSNDMKENISNCVDIDDLSDETVSHMLRFIYHADVEELGWGRATELYRAADKYQILDLKDICASYLKTNLRPKNACEALVLADLYQDEDLKRCVQEFVIREGEKIINSKEWEKLMETHLKLTAETMLLNLQVLLQKKC